MHECVEFQDGTLYFDVCKRRVSSLPLCAQATLHLDKFFRVSVLISVSSQLTIDLIKTGFQPHATSSRNVCIFTKVVGFTRYPDSMIIVRRRIAVRRASLYSSTTLQPWRAQRRAHSEVGFRPYGRILDNDNFHRPAATYRCPPNTIF
ncbi:uncharacterized protein ARMOST_00060 [Armillaria ostoyae]|uniref:Uncharacterized protein n=1 Tax=Armillaria ostoyae TaxID=47428 RepID=A0A284QK27_ARMOS|nr:uncharacterized protein ARMOST_00060 [Armillaria ostoyae]